MSKEILTHEDEANVRIMYDLNVRILKVTIIVFRTYKRIFVYDNIYIFCIVGVNVPFTGS